MCTIEQAEAEAMPCIVIHGCQIFSMIQDKVLRLKLRLRHDSHGNSKPSISTVHNTQFEAHVAILYQLKYAGMSIEHSSLYKKQQAETEARPSIVMHDSLMLAGYLQRV